MENPDLTGGAILDRLSTVIASRKSVSPKDSYVAHLFAEGEDVILKKIGEEAAETIIAAKSGDADRVVRETADLWFHCLVMLAHQGLAASAVCAELERRAGRSGLAEKAARNHPAG